MSQYIFRSKRSIGKQKFLQDVLDNKYRPGERLPGTEAMRAMYASNSQSLYTQIVDDLKADGIVTTAFSGAKKDGLILAVDCYRAIDIITRDVMEQLENALRDCLKFRIPIESVETLVHKMYDDGFDV